MTNRPSRERLAFNFGSGTVLSRGVVDSTAEQRNSGPHGSAVAPMVAKDANDWGYLGLLAFTAVLVLRPQDQIPGLSALHLAEVTALGAVASMVMQRVSRGLPLMRMTPEMIGLLVFGVAILGSVPFSIWPGGTFGLFTDSYVKLLVVFVLMMNTLTSPRRLEQIIWLLVLCCGYVAARSIFDYLRGINLVEGDRLAGSVGGIFGNPNDLAMNMVTFLPSAAIVALAPRYSTARRLVAGAAATLMFAAIIFTKSRGGALGLAAMLLTLMLLGRRVRPGLATIAILILVAASPFMPSSFWARMASIADDRKDKEQFSGSRETRSTVMREGIQTFLEHPLTGVGAGQFPNYAPPWRKERWRESHNALIQVAAETGVLGLLAFSFLIVRGGLTAAATRKMLDPPRKRGALDPAASAISEPERRAMLAQTVAMTAGLAGWFICALFGSIAYNWTFYILLALIVSANELVRRRLAAARQTARVAVAGPPRLAIRGDRLAMRARS